MVVGQPGKLVLTYVGCGFKSHPRRSEYKSGVSAEVLETADFLQYSFSFK